MLIEYVVALILVTFITSYYLGYREGREDGLAFSAQWRRSQEKSKR